MLTFSALCTVALLGHSTFTAPCRFTDSPAIGFNNHFSVVIDTYEPIDSLPRMADYVDVRSDFQGGMNISAVLVGSVLVTPDDPKYRSIFMNGSWETRPQNITVSMRRGRITVLIDEPITDFDGHNPSVEWLQRNRQAHVIRAVGVR